MPNSGDRRLASISNIGLSTSQFSNYQFTTTPENFISTVAETNDTSTVYPSVLTQTASYNNLNQLTNLSGQVLSFDANGNLLSDGLRAYAWDAESRLVAITYPAQPGKRTSFAYDGLGRRTAIASTPAGGGSTTTTSYIWCGARLCQARNASNATTREYYSEGEFVPGSQAQPYYYGVDRIGSVRRVFASAGSAPAYSYDPYGNALQATAPLTDLNYAGMFYNANSGLYLTLYRVYDPVSGRWLSREPRDESSDQKANLYSYVGGNPLSNVDPYGLVKVPEPADEYGNPLPPPTPLPPGKNGQPNSWVPCPASDTGDRGVKWKPQYPVPSPTGSQPQASWDPDGHWDIDDGQGNRQRVDPDGNPVSHPYSDTPSPPSPRWSNAPPWWILIPLFLPIPGNPIYGGL